MKLIGAGPGHKLKLTVAAPHFCVDGSYDDAHLANQVRAHVGCASKTPSKASGANVVHSISRDVDRSKAAQP